VLKHWESGHAGPNVFHSEWWLRAHWGRAFEILELARPPRSADGSPQVTHSYIALRKRPVSLTADELERCDPGESRELAALQTNVRLLRTEIDALVRDRSLRSSAAAALRNTVLRSPLRDLVRRLRRLVTTPAHRILRSSSAASRPSVDSTTKP
jgi:hypothetical protein